jgi:hypothetical protein
MSVISIISNRRELCCGRGYEGFSMWLDITLALIAIYLLTFTAILIVEAANII